MLNSKVGQLTGLKFTVCNNAQGNILTLIQRIISVAEKSKLVRVDTNDKDKQPLQFSPEHIAAELTLVDDEYLRSISPYEFMSQSWVHKTNKDKNARYLLHVSLVCSYFVCRNVVAWTQWFNTCTMWMTTKIIMMENLDQRVGLLFLDSIYLCVIDRSSRKYYTGRYGISKAKKLQWCNDGIGFIEFFVSCQIKGIFVSSECR